MTKTIELQDTTIHLINEARKRRPEWVDESDDTIIFHAMTEWLSNTESQSLNEWLQEFF